MTIDKVDCGFDSWTIEVNDEFQTIVHYWTHPYGLDITLCDASAIDFRRLANMFNKVADLKEKMKS